MSTTMNKPFTLSAALVKQTKDILHCEIEALRSISGYPGQALRSEIAGRLRVLHSLGLIDGAEEQALSASADAAREEGEAA